MAGGKTKLIHDVMEEFARRNIPYSPVITTDSTFMVDAVVRDHRETGGIHHIHAVGQLPGLHAYDPAREHLTFINVSPQMQRWMFEPFFTTVSNLPYDNQYHFVEAAVGGNGTPSDLPASQNDYSCKSLVEGLASGIYDTSWIPRVGAGIHVTSDYKLREYLNNEIRRKQTFVVGQDQSGEGSRPLPPAVLLFTMEDDVQYLREYLKGHGLDGRMTTIKNSGGPELFRRAMIELERHGIGLPDVRKGKETR